MNNEIPTHLGGWQNIVFGKVEEGDLLIPNDGNLSDASWAMGFIGESIESEYVRNHFRVYRKLPVAKQGDLDHAPVGTSGNYASAPDVGATIKGDIDIRGRLSAPDHEMRTDEPNSVLPSERSARKSLPIATGVIDYFPLVWAEVCKASLAGNKQHLDGKPLHWDRSKSSDHADSLMRHFIDRGKVDSDGVRHSAKVVWRACAMLQEELDTERKK